MTAVASYGTKANPIRWWCIRYVDAGKVTRGCEKCGQGIRYQVTLKSDQGAVLTVGVDCATTLDGGPELAEIRNAEAAWRHEQWLASPEYAAIKAREAAEAERRAKAILEAETVYAFELYALRLIIGSPNVGEYVKDLAKGRLDSILRGDRNWGPLHETDPKLADRLGNAAVVATLPPSSNAGAPGEKITRRAFYEASIPCLTEYGTTYLEKFRTESGEVLVWFTKACPLRPDEDLGTWVSIKGTVKKHKEYNGEPQTSLVRCKVTSPGLEARRTAEAS